MKSKKQNRIAAVYKITNLVNGKVYIGESLDIEERWNMHKQKLRYNEHHSYKLQSDYNTYGSDNFTYEIIEEIDKNYKYSLQQLILLVYENKYIEEYNSINEGYNVEFTLEKILNKEKGVFKDNIINSKHLKMLKVTIENIRNNNGVYIPSEKTAKKYNIELSEEQIIHKPKNKVTKIKEHKIYNNKFITEIYFPITFKDCIDYFLSTKYKLNDIYGYNDIYKKLREINVFYYNEQKLCLPKEEYLNKYFIIKRYKCESGLEYDRVYVLEQGLVFLENILLNSNIILFS